MIKFINPLKMSKWAYLRYGLAANILLLTLILPNYLFIAIILGIIWGEVDCYLQYRQGRSAFKYGLLTMFAVYLYGKIRRK